jgi:hypothetical protein
MVSCAYGFVGIITYSETIWLAFLVHAGNTEMDCQKDEQVALFSIDAPKGKSLLLMLPDLH